jgi:hypothetical protein
MFSTPFCRLPRLARAWLVPLVEAHERPRGDRVHVRVREMKTNQIIGGLLVLAAIACFWMESDDKSQADWKIDVLGIGLLLLGLWVGQFRFKKKE